MDFQDAAKNKRRRKISQNKNGRRDNRQGKKI